METFMEKLKPFSQNTTQNQGPSSCIAVISFVKSRGAYHLTENFGNSGWKINGKVTFRKFQPKIEE